jgi:hypothetical protein
MQTQNPPKPSALKKRPKPVLMIPLRRCGSHALRLRLNANPDFFYAPYPLHIVDFMPLVGLYGDLSDDRAYFQMVVDVVGLQAVSMVKWPNVVFDPVDVFDAIKNEPRSVHRVVWELLFQCGIQHGARVVMDKSLDSVQYADELLKLFDDMLFLNVVRDPRAQINSMNRAIIHDFDSLLNAMTWVKSYALASQLAAQYPERVLTIRYEDFIANQETVLRKVCDFFEIEFTLEMLDVSDSEEAQRISTMSALWESNAFPPIAANVDKFKKTMSLDEIAIIETLAGEQMDRYGYERMTTGKVEITDSMIAAAKERSDAKRKQAWADLANKDHRDYALRQLRINYLRMVKDRLLASGTK